MISLRTLRENKSLELANQSLRYIDYKLNRTIKIFIEKISVPLSVEKKIERVQFDSETFSIMDQVPHQFIHRKCT